MKYKVKKFFTFFTILLCSTLCFAQQNKAGADEEKQLRESIDTKIENYTISLKLEDWQVFYLDSILTHDYTAMMEELKELQISKAGNSDSYERVMDKWMEKIYQANQKIFNEEQWKKYLKQGAGREKKDRDKRAEKRSK